MDEYWPRVELPAARLAQLPGMQSEHTMIVAPWVDCLADKIRRVGWNESSYVTLCVYDDAALVLADGNHRVRAAMKAGIERVPCRLHRMEGIGRSIAARKAGLAAFDAELTTLISNAESHLWTNPSSND